MKTDVSEAVMKTRSPWNEFCVFPNVSTLYTRRLGYMLARPLGVHRDCQLSSVTTIKALGNNSTNHLNRNQSLTPKPRPLLVPVADRHNVPRHAAAPSSCCPAATISRSSCDSRILLAQPRVLAPRDPCLYTPRRICLSCPSLLPPFSLRLPPKLFLAGR